PSLWERGRGEGWSETTDISTATKTALAPRPRAVAPQPSSLRNVQYARLTNRQIAGHSAPLPGRSVHQPSTLNHQPALYGCTTTFPAADALLSSAARNASPMSTNGNLCVINGSAFTRPSETMSSAIWYSRSPFQLP